MNGQGASPSTLVLNVDDDEGNRYVRTRILRSAGFDVVEAGHGADALRIARERRPAVVLLDVRLPDINGIEVCRRLKADPVTAQLMVLQTSAALVSTADRVRGLQGGADHYLAQPFEADELVASVQALVRIHRAEQAMREAARQAQSTAAALATRTAWLELLADATTELLGATDVDGMLQQLFERIAPALGLDAYIHFSVDGEALVLASYGGLSVERADALQHRLPLGGSVCGAAVLTGRMQAVAGIGASDDPRTGVLRGLGLEVYACAPLHAHGRIVGALGFGRRSPRPFAADELQLLRTLCSSVAVARERLLYERQLLEQAQRMLAADRRKDEFLAMLSHELRNPLSPLVNAHRLLARPGSSEADRATALAMAERQTRQLQRLVDDLLEVSRITRGLIELRPEPMSVRTAVRAAVESIAAVAQQRSQSIEVAMPDAPVAVVADPARVAQVLENLLHNASKYTPDGGRIRVEVEERSDEVEIRVVDDGAGIDPDQIQGLFEMFSQLDTTLDRSQGGLGIGLALVRRLVELHGGRVAARSEGRGRGATFVVVLPRGEGGAPPRGTDHSTG